jgi:hypothetical protein
LKREIAEEKAKSKKTLLKKNKALDRKLLERQLRDIKIKRKTRKIKAFAKTASKKAKVGYKGFRKGIDWLSEREFAN